MFVRSVPTVARENFYGVAFSLQNKLIRLKRDKKNSQRKLSSDIFLMKTDHDDMIKKSQQPPFPQDKMFGV